MISLNTTLKIEKLGARGEGVARGAKGPVFVPYALAGETIIAEVDGDRGKLVEIKEASPDRVDPFCPHYTICGGCAVQALAEAPYAEWKRGLVVAALKNAGVIAEVGPLVDAHGAGRRRVTFHSRTSQKGNTRLGFMQARAHDIVDLDDCPILSPTLNGAIEAARAAADALGDLRKPLDLVVTATDYGLDVDLRGCGKLEFEYTQKLVAVAQKLDLARIANHGFVVIERRPPLLKMGIAGVSPPPGTFLQATAEGEATLARLVLEATKGAKRVADLFSGIGTFALRLTQTADVHAVEMDDSALKALARAAHTSQGLRKITTETRDLFRRPLLIAELNTYDAVVFDPPRAGAEMQAKMLAGSKVPVVVAVSCSPQSFARDAGVLIRGGYTLESVTPVDQFRHSAHVELVAVFRRTNTKARGRGRLLG